MRSSRLAFLARAAPLLPLSAPQSPGHPRHALARRITRRINRRTPARFAMTAATDNYARLTTLCKEISNLSSILGVLGWDEQVMMPAGAADLRGDQKAALTAIVHNKATSNDLRDAIAAAKATHDNLSPEERAVVRDAEREYSRAVGVPPELEEAIAKQEVAAVAAWGGARKNDDFASFVPLQTEMLQLTKEKALAMCPTQDPYDTLIDTFERGMSADRLEEIFSSISTPLKRILQNTLDAKAKCTKTVHPSLKGGDHWSVDKQVKFSNQLSEVLGFDKNKGRIDVSLHPFTGGAGPEDVRITTRYSKEMPFEGVTGTVHEVGHALYEQGRNAKYRGLPVSEALSMGVHESQSLFWERMIGLNINFWEAVLPKLHECVPHTKDVTASDVFFAINQVNPGLIRVDADELTYTFHIIMRFELEKKLVRGQIGIDELPQVWKTMMKEQLGVDVPDDKDGCLQDIHWPSGAFGYFPSYSLGAMMAAQLFHHLKTSAMPDIEQKIRTGELHAIRNWLRTEIHEVGSLYPSLDELLLHVTNERLNPQYFLDYLEDKYAKVYTE